MFSSWCDDISKTHPPRRNYELWEDNILTAKDKRTLITWCMGDAWDRLSTAHYQRLRWTAFQHAGMLVTAVGSNDRTLRCDLNKSIEVVIPPPGTDFEDENDAYAKKCWSRHPEFDYGDAAEVEEEIAESEPKWSDLFSNDSAAGESDTEVATPKSSTKGSTTSSAKSSSSSSSSD
jgi:hypothetical protein